MSAFLDLKDYISRRMRMSHIYQPVMLRELLRLGGEAKVEDIAKALLSYDKSQVEYYALRAKNMVGKVLTSNGVAEPVKQGRATVGYRLTNANAISASECSELISACDKEIDGYIEKRGDRIWSHRTVADGYISGTLRYEVLKGAKFRCELCGVSAEEKALEVDHILPRNRGGSDGQDNLQALCYSCNAMKRDRDDTDFRGTADVYQHRKEGCIFCDIDAERVIAENELSVAIRDAHPVTLDHTLVIPKRHVSDYFDLYRPELNSVNRMLGELRVKIRESDTNVSGFNVGTNSGMSAGQTVFHCHIHLIPRREGDVEYPRGGVRGVIREKQSY